MGFCYAIPRKTHDFLHDGFYGQMLDFYEVAVFSVKHRGFHERNVADDLLRRKIFFLRVAVEHDAEICAGATSFGFGFSLADHRFF